MPSQITVATAVVSASFSLRRDAAALPRHDRYRPARSGSPKAAAPRTASPTRPGYRRQYRSANSSETAKASGLFQLDQSAAEIFRMQEQHRLVMRAQSRFAVAQDPNTRRAQPVACCDNIVDLVAEMV